MSVIPYFNAERDAGIHELIRSTSSIAYASSLKSVERFDISEKSWSKLHRTKASVGDVDVHYLESILATVGWNKNDDVFDRIEMWVARATPVYKPLNYEHTNDDIIGTMISCKAIDGDGNAIADDASSDALPAKYHLLTGAVLWKVWTDKLKQERMDNTLAEISKGEWFVSMECLFKGFDYALKASDGTMRIVARNDKTAFLSKYLKAYGGNGTYGTYTVGRLLRNFIFSGEGLVRNPANPESIILDTNTEVFEASTAETLKDFIQLSAEQVYSPSANSHKEPLVADTNITELQTQNANLKADLEALKASIKDHDIKSIQVKVDGLTADLAKAKETIVTLEASNKAISVEAVASKATVEATNKELEIVTKSLADAQDELKKLHGDQVKAERLKQIVTTLKLDVANADQVKNAEELNTTLADLNGEAFKTFLATQAKFSTAQLPPKASPAPTAPLVTGKPAPMAGEDKTVDPASALATTAVLDAAKAEVETPLVTVPASDSVNILSKSVAEFLGRDDQK